MGLTPRSGAEAMGDGLDGSGRRRGSDVLHHAYEESGAMHEVPAERWGVVSVLEVRLGMLSRRGVR